MKLALAILFAVQGAGVVGAEVRTWTDAAGKFSIEAVFVKAVSGSVVLKKDNGKTITVTIAKLSASDQGWIRARAGGAAAVLERSWPQWLGPRRTGHTALPSGKWPPRKLWEKDFGDSDSSPIIVNGRIYLTTLEGINTGVKCVDAETGNLVWQGTTPGGRYARFSTGDKQSYSGPLSTPACDGSLLFTLSVDGDFQCWDAAGGEKKWATNLYDQYKMGKRDHIRDYGYASSPMLSGTDVLIEVGGNQGAVMAFDRESGRATGGWGKGQIGHSGGPAGPDGKVFFGLNHLSVDGQQIPWRTDYACNIATPAVSGAYVICTSAYNMRRTVCYRNGKELWTSKFHCKTSSPVIHPAEGHVYLPEAGKCLDLKTGEVRWTFPRAVNIVVTGDGKLIHFDREIRLTNLKGEVLHRVPAIDRQWPGGAFGDGYLVFKNRSTVLCYSVK